MKYISITSGKIVDGFFLSTQYKFNLDDIN